MGWLWRLGVLVAWLAALVWLVSVGSGEGLLYVWIGPPLTVAVGWLLDRWWVVAVPALATAVWLLITGGADDPCSSCYEDVRGLWVLLTLMFFTAPATAALALGVGARRLLRRLRRLEPGY